MDTTEILKKIRKIELQTRKRSQSLTSGNKASAFKGRGMAFSEVREYQFGDEIRTIDWNVTARFNHPYIKVFEEEREQEFLILIDVSASNNFGSYELKKFKAAEIAAFLAFSASINNDKTGIIFYSTEIEKVIKPNKGRKHVVEIITSLVNLKPQHKGSNLKKAIRTASNLLSKRSVVYIISDFDDAGYENELLQLTRKHEVTTFRIVDKLDYELPDIGLVKITDPETGKTQFLNTSNASTRATYLNDYTKHAEKIKSTLKKLKTPLLEVKTDADTAKLLGSFFDAYGSR